jgi:hypothetical protein
MKIHIILPFILCLIISPIFLNATIQQTNMSSLEQRNGGIGFSNKYNLSTTDVLDGNKTVLQAKLGKKLSFKERVVLHFAKNKLKKAKREGQDQSWRAMAEGNSNSDYWLGVILGILLGLIGVLIALIIGNKEVIRGSLYGLLALIIFLLLVLV